MAALARNPTALERESFDIIVIGGGIYGAMLSLEAGRYGLRSLMLERSDFGGSTSFNNLRIVHGGLRYLQTLHLSRFQESVSERRWFLQHFPDLVRPLPCMMPLYGGLVRNKAVMRAALTANDWLSNSRNVALPPECRLPNGRILNSADTINKYPLVRRAGLNGAALWYDAVMPECHRVLMEVMHWAAESGAAALNYVEVDKLIQSGRRVTGVIASDKISGVQHEFRAPVVVNAAGPDSVRLLKRFGIDMPKLFRPSWAWNLLFDRESLSRSALAIQPPTPGGRMYFVHSFGGRLFAGTGHAPAKADDVSILASSDEVLAMIGDLNCAIPGLRLEASEINRVFAGRLPVKHPGSIELADTATLVNHAKQTGIDGLFTVSGVKYTTARSTAAALIRLIVESLGDHPARRETALPSRPTPVEFDLRSDSIATPQNRESRLRYMIEAEAPTSLEDLLMRRGNLADDKSMAEYLADDACSAFGWDNERSKLEKTSLLRSFSAGRAI